MNAWFVANGMDVLDLTLWSELSEDGDDSIHM
jgi:hypothetical protein